MSGELILRCTMCLRKFGIPRSHLGRRPTNCPECAKRRKTEQARQAMARTRTRRRQAAAGTAGEP